MGIIAKRQDSLPFPLIVPGHRQLKAFLARFHPPSFSGWGSREADKWDNRGWGGERRCRKYETDWCVHVWVTSDTVLYTFIHRFNILSSIVANPLNSHINFCSSCNCRKPMWLTLQQKWKKRSLSEDNSMRNDKRLLSSPRHKTFTLIPSTVPTS